MAALRAAQTCDSNRCNASSAIDRAEDIDFAAD